ncbi:MAG TPA: hypothetical protein VGP67_06530 [Gaiellales bacterium]|nr:hypothetical protein [Gaiellales bacterium]
MEGDLRSFRVALVASELVNPAAGGVDALAVFEQEGWGAMQLPAADYPDEVAAPLLDQVAEQTEEFARHGYTLALVGDRAGLEQALERYGLAVPPAIEPAAADQLRAFLAATSRTSTPR